MKTILDYACFKCEQLFSESEILAIDFKEYEGASTQKNYVSPCCHAGFDYKENVVEAQL